MFVADILLNALSPVPIVSHKSFVGIMLSNYYSLRDSWGSSCDDIFELGKKENIQQVTINYLNKLINTDTLNDCESSVNSFYFDKTKQYIYVHSPLDSSPLFDSYDYGYSFGVSTRELKYIDDIEYTPIVTSYPEIEIEDDATGQKEPTGIVASISMVNLESDNLEGKKEGQLDFLLKDTSSCYGNDVYMYDYNKETNIKTMIGVATIKSISVSLQKVTLSLKDERMGSTR